MNEMLKYGYFSVIDANGKLGPGLLTGNSGHLGNFDECLEITKTDVGFQGQHCVAEVFIEPRDSAHQIVQDVIDLIQSHRIIRRTSNVSI